MSAGLHLPVELPIPESTLQTLREDAIDWAHGMVIRTAERKGNGDLCQAVPFALLPSPFPADVFRQALEVQKAMNLLYFRVSYDFEYLRRWHSEVVKSDAFTRGLLHILGKVMEGGGPRQKKIILTQRSDYMCHVRADGKKELKQIEVNHIAVGMGPLSERCTELHRRVLKHLGITPAEGQLPENRPTEMLGMGLFEAWKGFGDPKAIVLVVVENVNQNQIDQRWIEYELEELSEGQIEVMRLDLAQCAKRVVLDEVTGRLLLDGAVRIGLVYFRAGYSPENYPTETEWKARETIELSDAVKCPWIGLQVANTKKIQQALAQEGQVERFLPDRPELVPLIRATFAGLWGLENDDDETKAIIEEAKAHPEEFVLKPQLEGGGGNFYGGEIVQKLTSMTKDERSAHILMQRIRPLTVQNYLVRALTAMKLSNVVGELGIFGCLYGAMDAEAKPESGVVTSNVFGGLMLRTKCEDVNEGGVAVGAAVIDSPFLC
ncbi:hypothetical protein QR680_017143 [Steinernema hermaphroditum]|uniref:Glutathione synthetase n=1 Tax=Steinernema hermaphroditum TaxID=289476 RepID=A0AA39HFV9_9BILA|nr:hypothetical protein QR680_017143 [Steinernema hermaphroditum]